MGVGESRYPGHDAWIHAHQKKNQVCGDCVAEEGFCGGWFEGGRYGCGSFSFAWGDGEC